MKNDEIELSSMFLYAETVEANSARLEDMENRSVERTAVDSNSTCCWCLILTFGMVAHHIDPNPGIDRNDVTSDTGNDHGGFTSPTPTDSNNLIPNQVKSRQSKKAPVETVRFFLYLCLLSNILTYYTKPT